MSKLFPVALVGLAALSVVMVGCETDSYSDAIRYGLRADPVLMPGAKFGSEVDTPDRPGQLPLLKLADIDDPRNPFHALRDELATKEVFRDPTQAPADKRDLIAKTLEDLFGTPARPLVKGFDPDEKKVMELDPAVEKTLKVDAGTLAQGSKLYRQHCIHCHGVPGDGRGPTARWVNPHPRDFRQGIFKFQSVDQTKDPAKSKVPPRRDDLLRTLRQGIEGSAMPSFALLPEGELEALASYVIHLSLRGKAEYQTYVTAFEKDRASGALVSASDDYADPVYVMGVSHALQLQDWVYSQDPANAIKVTAYPKKFENEAEYRESVQRGRRLFIGDPTLPGAEAANCKSCHNNYGRQSLYRWDEWGTLAKPANFTQGVFRGGRRPVDIYYRIHSGINGSGMTSFGNVLDPARNAKVPQGSEYVWDLVNFVQTVSYKAMRDKLQVQID